MKTQIRKIQESNLKVKDFFLYLLFGGCGALSDIAIFKILIERAWDPILSNIVSTTIGVALSYRLNSRFTFRQRITFSRLLKFSTIAILGLVGSSLYIKFLTDGFGVSPIVAKMSSMPLVAVGQYLGNRIWTFRTVD